MRSELSLTNSAPDSMKPTESVPLRLDFNQPFHYVYFAQTAYTLFRRFEPEEVKPKVKLASRRQYGAAPECVYGLVA